MGTSMMRGEGKKKFSSFLIIARKGGEKKRKALILYFHPGEGRREWGDGPQRKDEKERKWGKGLISQEEEKRKDLLLLPWGGRKKESGNY